MSARPGGRVRLSGIGLVSAAGEDTAGTLASFRAGRRDPGPVTLFETPLACPVFETGLPQGSAAEGSRTLRLARRALVEALAEAGLDPRRDLQGPRVGVCLGTTVASQLNDLPFYTAFRADGRAPMEAVDRFLKGNLAEQLARELGAEGPCATIANACSSGADAIGTAWSWIRSGACDLAVAGGADEMNLVPLCGFHSLGVVSPEPCAPFDRDRRGLNLGEGAGILILEREEAAARRDAVSGLFVAGYGGACDAHHLTAPRPDGSGLESAVREALREAGAEPSDIAFVNAHGTATRDNDRVEGQALARLFGPDVRVLSTKGYVGHTLGAAGALEAGFTALALREGWVPASAGFRTPDPEIPLVPVTDITRIEGRMALSTSLAFGGVNAALVLERAP